MHKYLSAEAIPIAEPGPTIFNAGGFPESPELLPLAVHRA